MCVVVSLRTHIDHISSENAQGKTSGRKIGRKKCDEIKNATIRLLDANEKKTEHEPNEMRIQIQNQLQTIAFMLSKYGMAMTFAREAMLLL